MTFLEECQAVCNKATAMSARQNRATADNGSAAYWLKQQYNYEAGGSYDLLAPFIKVAE